jgi:mannose-6-phosphate isomerase-like protein (cupin superfamily)
VIPQLDLGFLFERVTVVLLLFGLCASTPLSAHPPEQPHPGTVRRATEGEVLRNDARGIEIIKITPEESKALGLATTRLKKLDARISVHLHEFDDEAFFVHKGSGVFILGDQRFPISEGDVVFIPRGTWHGFENGSKDTLLVWAISSSRYLELHRRLMSNEPEPPPAEAEAILRSYGFKSKE